MTRRDIMTQAPLTTVGVIGDCRSALAQNAASTTPEPEYAPRPQSPVVLANALVWL